MKGDIALSYYGIRRNLEDSQYCTHRSRDMTSFTTLTPRLVSHTSYVEDDYIVSMERG